MEVSVLSGRTEDAMRRLPASRGGLIGDPG